MASWIGIGTSNPGDVATNGKVGIGTTTPAAQLEVHGDPGTDGDMSFLASVWNNTDAYSTSPKVGYYGVTKYNSSGSYAGLGGMQIAKENGTSGSYASCLSLHTRANGGPVSSRLHINSAGLVGIGTTTPAAKLDVAGSAVFNSAKGTDTFTIKGDTDDYLLFANTDDNKVVIGTNSPALVAKLYVDGGTTHDAIAVNKSDGATYTNRCVIGSAGYAISAQSYYANAAVYVANLSTGPALVTNGGNVGIGSNSPTQLLDVNGNVKVGASNSYLIGSVKICSGSGSPNSVVTAPPGSLYLNTSGGAGTTLYVKESGTGNTGWVAK